MVMIWQKIDYFVRIKQREFPEAVVTYNYRILEGNTVIEDAEDIKQLQAEGKMNVLW